jgi:hypothetical protein
MKRMKTFLFAAVVIGFILSSSASAYYNIIDLGTLGGTSSYAYSINDNGQIVGWADGRACLFDSTGQGNNIDLNTLIDPSSGWTLIFANSINNHGWIVGQGINPAGYEHTYLLIPKPASALIMGIGGLLLTLRRRHC